MDVMTKMVLRAEDAYRDTVKLTDAMDGIVEDLANWTAGQEPHPPIEDMDQALGEMERIMNEWRAVRATAVQAATIRARAAGGSWTPSPEVPKAAVA